MLQFHDSNWFFIILLVRKQWETKYHTKKLTLNVALSFFSFALGVDHTPWWKKNITHFQHSAGVHVHKAQIGNNLLTKQQYSNLEVKRLVVTMVKDLLNQVWVCVKRYIILTLSEFKTKTEQKPLSKNIHQHGWQVLQHLKIWKVECYLLEYICKLSFISWNQW